MIEAQAFDAAATLASLRSTGAHDLDPVRFCYLEAMLRRSQSAPDPVRRIVEGKLQAALAEYAGRKPAVTSSVSKPLPTSALTALNAYVRSATQQDAERGTVPTGRDGRPELKSVQAFREVWSRFAVVDQVEQSLQRGPENAGPFNSHALVLRSLATMRELSPEYLCRFLSHAETLIWLEQEGQRVNGPQVGAVLSGRRRKQGRG